MPVALVTGAARGIGAATAETLAASGWKVALLDGCDEFGPNLAAPEPPSVDELRAATERCRVHAPALDLLADVRSPDAVRRALEVAVSELGPIDAAVAAAGKISGHLAWETPAEIWQELFAVNVGGVHNLADAVVPHFLEEGGPKRFVAVASASAGKGLEKLAAYGATKSAVVGYVRGLAADLAGTEVTANAVSPGSTGTRMLDASAAVYGLESADAFAEHQLLRRILAPEEVAAGIAFLCSPESSGITGAVIPVDGGMTA